MNLFFNLQNKTIILSNHKIRLKKKSWQYKKLVNKAEKKVIQLMVDIAKKVEEKKTASVIRQILFQNIQIIYKDKSII